MAEGAKVEVRKLGDRADKSAIEAMSEAEVVAEKARLLQVLGMGLVTDAIRVDDADPNRRYAYVRERDIDIKKFEALGYRVETQKGEGTHGAGDNRRRVGDVILMSVDRARHDLIEEVRREKVAARMDSPVREYKERATSAAAKSQAAPPIDLTEGD
jgi:hypothetical protein